MTQQLSVSLERLIQKELPALRSVSEATATIRPGGDASWSPKEELGHLIDSAANNHIRFVRAAIQSEFRGDSYAQNEWVRLHAYQQMDWPAIIDFWFHYNAFLVSVLAQVPGDKLENLCFVGAGEPVTLGFLIDDYILHVRHHLDHLLGRKIVTPYPRR